MPQMPWPRYWTPASLLINGRFAPTQSTPNPKPTPEPHPPHCDSAQRRLPHTPARLIATSIRTRVQTPWRILKIMKQRRTQPPLHLRILHSVIIPAHFLLTQSNLF